jgi:hypothetical protein
MAGAVVVSNVPGDTSDAEICALAAKKDGTLGKIVHREPDQVMMIWPDDTASLLKGCPEMLAAARHSFECKSKGKSLTTLSFKSYEWSIPSAVGLYASLRTIDCSFCTKLKFIPDTIGNCVGLEELNLNGCSSLKGLPNTLRKCTRLLSIDCRDCTKLETLSATLTECKQLALIMCTGCPQLHIPESLENHNIRIVRKSAHGSALN